MTIPLSFVVMRRPYDLWIGSLKLLFHTPLRQCQQITERFVSPSNVIVPITMEAMTRNLEFLHLPVRDFFPFGITTFVQFASNA